MQTDQLFKEIIRFFFKEFITLFFPNIAAQLDFSTLLFLEKEVFTDLVTGRRQEIDLLARVNTWEGDPKLFHIENQARQQANFPKRMSRYYSFLEERHQQPIFQIALLLHRGTGGLTRQVYEEWELGRPFRIHYYDVIGLADLAEKDYRERNEPLAVGLSAHMAGDRRAKARRKAECLRRILELEPREAHRFLLVNLVETGLPLSPSQEKEFQRITETSRYSEVKEMRLIYEEQGIQKGLERGRQEGKQEGKQEGLLEGKKELLLRYLKHRFGSVTEEIRRRIEAIEASEDVDHWMDRAFQVASLTDLDAELTDGEGT